MLGLFRTKLLTKTRLWRGFIVRLPEGSLEPTRQLVAVLVDSVCMCEFVLTRSDPKMEDLEFCADLPFGRLLWNLDCGKFKRSLDLEFGLMVKENILGFKLGFGA